MLRECLQMENEQTLAVFCTETDILAILEDDAIQALMERANVSLLEAAEALEKAKYWQMRMLSTGRWRRRRSKDGNV